MIKRELGINKTPVRARRVKTIFKLSPMKKQKTKPIAKAAKKETPPRVEEKMDYNMEALMNDSEHSEREDLGLFGESKPPVKLEEEEPDQQYRWQMIEDSSRKNPLFEKFNDESFEEF